MRPSPSCLAVSRSEHRETLEDSQSVTSTGNPAGKRYSIGKFLDVFSGGHVDPEYNEFTIHVRISYKTLTFVVLTLVGALRISDLIFH